MEDKYIALKLENQLCFPLYAASREVIRLYKTALNALDLTYTQYITMMVLWESGAVSSKRLGDILYLDSGTLTPMLKTMERKGLIMRRRDKEDERKLLVSLTERGEALKDAALSVPESVGSCLNLSEDEATTLYTLLYKILKQTSTLDAERRLS